MDLKFALFPALAVLSFGCSSDTKTDSQYENDVLTGMHQALLSDVDALHEAAIELQEADPSPK